MAVYKVPQDVEADDKLLGPFNFRQFVYLIIAAVAGFVGWLLWNLTPFLAIIPVPIVIFFVILALPLRKDQPMEIYLLAVVQFLLKPKKRLWDPDGIIALVQVTAPKTKEPIRTKDISGGEAANRLSYLAQVMDTHGWASRDTSISQSVNDDVAIEAEQTEDVFDTDTSVSRSFDSLIDKHNTSYRQDLMNRLKQQPAQAQATPPSTPNIPGNPYSEFVSNPPDTAQQQQQEEQPEPQNIKYQPYPDMHQQVISPSSAQQTQQQQAPAQQNQQPQQQQPAAQPQPATQQPQPQQQPAQQQPPEDTTQNASAQAVSPGIIDLARNQDLTVSTIANEAHRREKSGQSDDENEVVISLH